MYLFSNAALFRRLGVTENHLTVRDVEAGLPTAATDDANGGRLDVRICRPQQIRRVLLKYSYCIYIYIYEWKSRASFFSYKHILNAVSLNTKTHCSDAKLEVRWETRNKLLAWTIDDQSFFYCWTCKNKGILGWKAGVNIGVYMPSSGQELLIFISAYRMFKANSKIGG